MSVRARISLAGVGRRTRVSGAFVPSGCNSAAGTKVAVRAGVGSARSAPIPAPAPSNPPAIAPGVPPTSPPTSAPAEPARATPTSAPTRFLSEPPTTGWNRPRTVPRVAPIKPPLAAAAAGAAAPSVPAVAMSNPMSAGVVICRAMRPTRSSGPGSASTAPSGSNGVVAKSRMSPPAPFRISKKPLLSCGSGVRLIGSVTRGTTGLDTGRL